MALIEDKWVRENVWLRMLLLGPTGSGKTNGALSVADVLAREFEGLPIIGLDTERGRMKLVADKFNLAAYYKLEGDYSPEAYVGAIDVIEKKHAGGVLVVDSVSMEWNGKNGIMDAVDRFGGWKEATPRHNLFVDRLMATQMHLICCCRAKMKYTQEEVEEGGRKRQVVRKLGLGPEQRDNFLYEFDIVGDVDLGTHQVTFSNRCDPLVGTTRSLVPGEEVGTILHKWLTEGEPPEPPETASDESVEMLTTLLLSAGITQVNIDKRFAAARLENRGALHPDWVAKTIGWAESKIKEKETAEAEPTRAPAS